MTKRKPEEGAGERQMYEKKPASEKLARAEGDATSAGGGSPESMRGTDKLSKPERQENRENNEQKRTVGNHPADPNRQGADRNLLPPGISDDDVRDPGSMTDKKK